MQIHEHRTFSSPPFVALSCGYVFEQTMGVWISCTGVLRVAMSETCGATGQGRKHDHSISERNDKCGREHVDSCGMVAEETDG